MTDDDTTKFLMTALGLSQSGPLSEDMEQRVVNIVAGQAASMLAGMGVSVERLEQLFVDEEWTIVLQYEDGRLRYGVEWPNGDIEPAVASVEA